MIGQHFDTYFKTHAEKIALRYADKHLTYADLYQLVLRLVANLQQYHHLFGEVILIASDKTAEAYALMFACQRLGLVYCHIDPATPAERLRAILQTTQAKAIYHDPSIQLDLPDDLTIARVDFATIGNATDTTLKSIPEHHPAYLMFTSGSTGKPKAVMISHSNLRAFIAWTKTVFSITDQDIFTQLNPLYFDNSVFDVYAALGNGASIAPIPHAYLSQPQQLLQAINARQCTHWFSVPSLLIYLLNTKALPAIHMPTIRRFIFGGEGFPKPLLKQLYDIYYQQAELINVYGPTECTCICSVYPIGENDFNDMQALAPLGQLVEGFNASIRDNGQLVGEGEVGELFLTGDKVGLGYYRDADLTQKSFSENTYQTGDLVYQQAGLLHFVGRKDNQIKHLGYRIELEEIECALLQLAYVQHASVIYTRSNANAGELVAFIATDSPVSLTTLRQDLQRYIPAYMLPTQCYCLEQLPRNANGKIDKISLQRQLA